MTLIQVLSRECVEVILDAIGWKYNEGSMEYDDWKKIEPLMAWIKTQYPDLADDVRYSCVFK